MIHNRPPPFAWITFAGLLALMFTTCPHGSGQSLDVSQYGHSSWTAEEGAFRGSINAVGQTTDGYLWLGTGFGLLHFDGVRFVSWKVPEGQSLPKLPITRVFGAPDGSLWIGGLPGLARLHDAKLTNYHELDQIGIDTILEDSRGVIWAGGARNIQKSLIVLCRIEQERTQCFGNNQFLGPQVHALFEDHESRLWAATENGIWQMQPGSPKKISDLATTSISEDAQGNLLFATTGDGLNVLGSDGNLRPYLSPRDGKPIKAKFLMKDREGSLWMSDGVQGILHIHDGRMDSFTVADGLTGNVYGLLQDREGNVWTPTTNGLDRFRRLAIPAITERQGLSSNVGTSLITAKDGTTWIATENKLNRMNGSNFTSFGEKEGLPADGIQSLLETDSGRLLVATAVERGLAWFENGRATRLAIPADGNVFAIAAGGRGEMWVLAHEPGLLHLNSDGALLEVIPLKNIRIHLITATYDPVRDGMWLTGARGELGFLKDGRIKSRYGEKDGLGRGIVRDAQVFPDGSVWVATEVGLARLKDDKFSFLNRKNGLPCDDVQWMREDDEHTVWLNTECGLIRLSHAELDAWAAHPDRQVKILTHLDNTDGAANIALGFWYAPQVARANDGRILFLTAKGIGILDPKNLNTNLLPPPVHIEEVTADGRALDPAGPLTLAKRVHELRIAYTALSLVIPQKVRFRYQLEGYDRGWSEPTPARSTTYTNLPPGRYRFRVIAANNSGVWNNVGDSINFRVPPAFSQTVWFPLLLIAVALILIAALFYWRLRAVTLHIRERTMARMAERERIARDLHDTLLQGFQALVVSFQAVAETIPSDQPARPMMEKVLDRADEVLVEGRDRVRDLRSTETTEGELAEQLQKIATELQLTVPTDFELSTVGSPRRFSTDAQEELLAIGREALTNAFRHAGASRITCELIFEQNAFVLVCRDNGTGIADNVLSSGGREGHWGLMGMEERAANIGGVLRIQSSETMGTRVELKLKAGIAFPSAGKRHKLNVTRSSTGGE